VSPPLPRVGSNGGYCQEIGITTSIRTFDAAGPEDPTLGPAPWQRAAKGAAAGAGAGLLFGLAALAIPGVGPFITAGALASALGTTGGALAAGAIVGGTSGAIAGGLSKAGYSREESQFYGPAVERGGVRVVDLWKPEERREGALVSRTPFPFIVFRSGVHPLVSPAAPYYESLHVAAHLCYFRRLPYPATAGRLCQTNTPP
jgi:hypothetical protein